MTSCLMKSLAVRAAALLVLLAVVPARGLAAEAPDAAVRATVEEVLSAIRNTTDRAQLRRIAEQKVLPHFDFAQMTRLAVGAPWRRATPEQRKRLEDGFRTLLVNTYVNALQAGGKTERSVAVTPLPPGAQQAREVTVKTVVKEGSRPPIPIDYRMSRESGEWKVFDVLVEGVSLVSTYRGTFNDTIRTSGIDGLIGLLEDRNRSLGSGS